MTPLHLSAKAGHIEVVRCLLLSGASVDLPNRVSCVSFWNVLPLCVLAVCPFNIFCKLALFDGVIIIIIVVVVVSPPPPPYRIYAKHALNAAMSDCQQFVKRSNGFRSVKE